MAWQLLAAALPAAAKVAGTYLQKPSREDYKPQTDYMKKYLGYLRGRSAGKEVMHMAMQPQLRAIGRQGREMQRQVGYDVAKTGLTGSGIEAQMRLSAGAQTQEALSEATGKAAAAQAADDARIGEKSADLAARIESEEQRAEQAYETAGRQWKRQMGSEVLGLGASIAGAKITQAGQLKEAGMLATRSGHFGTAEDVQRMIDEGWTAEMWRQEIPRMDKLVGTYKGFSRDEIIGAQNLMTGSDVPLTGDIDADPALAAAEAGAETVRDETYTYDPFQEELLSERAMKVSAEGAVEDPETVRAKQHELYNRAVESGFKGSIDDWEKSFEEAVKPEVKPVVEEAVKAEVTKKVQPKAFAEMMEGIRPVARKNADGSVSTVVLAQSDNLVYPTIFPKDPDSPTSDPDDWIELEGDAALAEAKKRGEIFELGSEEEAIKIAEGSWKPEETPVVTPETDTLKLRRDIKSRPKSEQIEYDKELKGYRKAQEDGYKGTFEKYRALEYHPTTLTEVYSSKKENLDKAVDAIWKLESDRGKDIKGIEKRTKDPKSTATGEMQQTDPFYEDLTTRMGYPEYDRNNPDQAKEAAKHYLKWVMDNEGLDLASAVRSYKAGVRGSKKGEGSRYYDAFSKIYGEV
jgi:hypothetical protein